MASQETRTTEQAAESVNGDSSGQDSGQFLTWWAYVSYAIAVLGVLGGLFSLVNGLATLGSASVMAASGATVPGQFGFGAFGLALIVGAIVTLGISVLIGLVGRGVARRSATWWTRGMIVYGVGLVFSLFTFNVVGVVLLAVGLFLGYQGREAVEGSTPI